MNQLLENSNRPDLSSLFALIPRPDHRPPTPSWYKLEDMEREHILKVLKKTGFNKSKAAGLLGIARKTLRKKIERYDISLQE